MLACQLPDLAPNFQATALVRALLIAKADAARASDEHCLTALHVAAESLPPQISNKSHSIERLPHTPVSSRPHPLPLADGHLGVVQELVRVLNHAQIDHTLANGMTALMLACKIGHPTTAKALLEVKADPMLYDKTDGFSPIMHAALFGHIDCVTTVLRNAGQGLHTLLHERNKDHFTALHLAALHGQRRVVQLLLRERAEVDSANKNGETPLHVSSKNGHAQVVCALLASGAHVNQVDNVGRTALHHCSVTPGGKDVADALMEVGAEVNLEDHDQNTPLHLACMTGNHLIVDTLLKFKVRGCDGTRPEPRISVDY